MKTKYIKQLLMCKPLHFQVEYVINPWMKVGSVDLQLAKRQWEQLVEKLEKLQIKVEYIDQKKNLPDMVFAADQGIVKQNQMLLSNFKYKERQGEGEAYLPWFEKNGFDVLKLSEGSFFEGGGESSFVEGKLLVGTGFRTNKKAVSEIAEKLNVETLGLELVNPNFYHLDTCFLPLNSKTAFFYPTAFSKKSQAILQALFPKLIAFSEQEVNSFAANSLVTDHHVIVQKGSDSFKQKLDGLGYRTVETNVSEFIKAGGGIHCLVQVLKEEYE